MSGVEQHQALQRLSEEIGVRARELQRDHPSDGMSDEDDLLQAGILDD
jgi:hypothetical protein